MDCLAPSDARRSNGQCRCRFNFLHRDLGLDTLYTRDPRQVLALKPSVGIEVGRDNTKQEIAVTGHEVAFNDFSEPLDFGRKSINGFRVLAREPNPYEDGEPDAQFRRTQLRRIALDHARILKDLDTPQAWRWRKAHPFGQVHILNAPLLLEDPKNSSVNGIERFWSVGIHVAKDGLSELAQNINKTAIYSTEYQTCF